MRRFLLVMGLIFTGLIGIGLGSIGYVGILASQSQEHNTSRAINLVQVVSQTWSVDYSQEIFTPVALAQASTPEGRRALAVMSRLGQLQSAQSVRQTGYKIDFETGTTVTVTFEGRFEHGTAQVIVMLQFENDEARIVELNLKKIETWKKRQRTAAV